MNCFLLTAEYLSFTKAAERLYLSQPGLSKQIGVLERELGVQLFDRTRNTIKLTKAGIVCVDHFKRIREEWQDALSYCASAKSPSKDSLVIGGIEGQLVGECYKQAFLYFWTRQPNTKITCAYYSISELGNALVEGEVDVAIMPEGDAKRLQNIDFRRSCFEECCLIVSKNHPKADSDTPRLEDFTNETFLVLSESESYTIYEQHRSICEAAGFEKQRMVTSWGTLSLLLEVGAGITVLSRWHSLRHAAYLKFLPMANLGNQIEVFAWNLDNKNPNIPILINQVDLNIDKE
jgi:DNA-binding transcriptional LysR family regulator